LVSNKDNGTRFDRPGIFAQGRSGGQTWPTEFSGLTGITGLSGTQPASEYSEAPGMSDVAHSLTWRGDEAVLVTELQAGSDAAFEWLVTYYHAPVYNLVYGILMDAADAADVSQEVFLRAFRGIGGFRRGSSLKTWLYRISVREALNHRRWCWRHHRNQVSIDDDADGTATPMELEDLDATPFDRLASNEVQAVVRKALAQVPEVFRGAVILRDIEGMSYEEVAEILDISVGTVKSRILRGRRALRELLDPLLHSKRTLPSTATAFEANSASEQTAGGDRVNSGLTPAPAAAAADVPMLAMRTSRGGVR
jgi:RNA polymerase sigma-70 factor (ECF subfamily)